MPKLFSIDSPRSTRLVVWSLTETEEELALTISRLEKTQRQRLSQLNSPIQRAAFWSLRHLMLEVGLDPLSVYYTPNGRSIQAKGIQPDIEVAFEIIEKKEKTPSIFDRMMKEKDLKNSLKPEGKDPEAPEMKKADKIKPGKTRQILEAEQLEMDAQVKRALDILVSYGVFSKLNGH